MAVINVRYIAIASASLWSKVTTSTISSTEVALDVPEALGNDKNMQKLLMLGLHWDHAFHALHVLEKREGRRGSCDQSGMIVVERA